METPPVAAHLIHHSLAVHLCFDQLQGMVWMEKDLARGQPLITW